MSRDDGMKVRVRALRLLGRARVPLNTDRREMWFDGRAIAAGYNLGLWEILHEAGHWLMALPAMRLEVNYGLGIDPDMATPKDVETNTKLPDGAADYAETLASAAGILLLACCKGSFVQNLKYHSWETNERGDLSIREAGIRLRAHGIFMPKTVVDRVVCAWQKMVR